MTQNSSFDLQNNVAYSLFSNEKVIYSYIGVLGSMDIFTALAFSGKENAKMRAKKRIAK